MPWKVAPVSEIRLAFVHYVGSLGRPVAEACRKFRISRKTGHKWLRRFRELPQQPLDDRSRGPRRSPRRTVPDVEARALELRNQFGWGPRKIHAVLREQGVAVPSVRTFANLLKRLGCVNPRELTPAWQRFERERPHQLWQCDHKGPLEVARQKVHPLVVLDDHSRFLLALHPCLDLTMKTAFDVLWIAFGEFGLPDALLADNAFGTTCPVPKTLFWFDAQLVRLGIQPLHGRPYHPQTQGKTERLNGTLQRELWPRTRRDALEHFQQDLDHWRTQVYNVLRPHEALGDRPPLTRFAPSTRRRPPKLPEVQYADDALVRKVSQAGDVRWRGYRILAGNGLRGETVRIEERDHEVALFYAWKEIRTIPFQALERQKLL
jgi:transposase InsO family protein